MKPIIRGSLYFYTFNFIIEVYNGDRNEHDSEFICAFDKTFLDSFIAGLTAIKTTNK